MAVGDLYTACSELLAVCAEACASFSPGGPMHRIFVAPGPPAWDCSDQLCVHAGGPAVGDTAPLAPPLQPSHRIEEGRMLNLVMLTVTTLRCAPVLEGDGQTLLLPLEAELDATAQATLGDLWAIWNHVATRKRNGTLWPPNERELFFDPAVPLPPAGGLVGWQIQMRVQVNGYRTV